MHADFVKASTTSVSAEASQGAVIAMLHRYGASGFGFRRRGTVVEVQFFLPVGSAERTVRIPVDVSKVNEKLERLQKAKVARGRHVSRAVPVGQAERVAWRILLLWIEAALSAVALGAQSLEEAFFAHLVVETVDGQEGRMIDYAHTLTAAAGNDGRLPALGRAIGTEPPALPSGS